jgi:hypothetical protein
VRNVCYTQLSRSRAALSNVVFDEEQHQGADLIVMRKMEGLSY